MLDTVYADLEFLSLNLMVALSDESVKSFTNSCN